MHRNIFFTAILASGFLFSCSNSNPASTGNDSAKATDTTTHAAQPSAPGNTVMSVNKTISPVSKRVSDSIYNGEFIERYDNGVIRKRGHISGGVAHGEWLSFYPSGKLWSKGTYVDGLRNGYGVSYYENGQKSSEGYYKDGNFVGEWKFWDERGNMTRKNYGDGGK